MSDCISRQALYDRAATLEAQALDYVGKLIERDGDEYSTEWKIWSAILAERTAFKHDVFDAPSAQPEIIRCKFCKYHPNNPRPYADNDPIETFIHCQFMEANDFCSKGKAITEEQE